jgi:hypothetical protein
MVLSYCCWFFFAPLGEKEPTTGKKTVAYVYPLTNAARLRLEEPELLQLSVDLIVNCL